MKKRTCSHFHSRLSLIDIELIDGSKNTTMVYIRPDGSVSNRRNIWRNIEDFIKGVIAAISLFFSSFVNPPHLENRSQQQRHYVWLQSDTVDGLTEALDHGGGVTFMDVKHLGPASAPMGGG